MLTKKLFTVFAVLIMSLSPVISIGQSSLYTKETTDHYDYIIITSVSLQNAVKPLKEWREKQGYSVKIVTGYHNPEKIRNFLKDHYLEWKIKYVLIVGSCRTIPMKYCWPNPDEHNFLKSFKTGIPPVPTDYYYAELTCNWDKDKDGYYGEYKDDIDNLTDFQPELNVGRIPFDNIIMVKRFCKKIIDYEKDNGEWKKKVLLLGGIARYENTTFGREDTSENLELLKNNVFVPNDFNCTTMYEKEGISPSNFSCDYPLNHENVLNQWKTGYGFVNWMGHTHSTEAFSLVWLEDDGDGVPEKGEVKDNVYFRSFDSYCLNDDKPSVVFGFSCMNIPPEEFWVILDIIYFRDRPYPISLGMSLLQRSAVVFIGCVRPTSYFPIEYNFFKYIVSFNENYGNAFYKAKSDYLKAVDGGSWKEIEDDYGTIYNTVNIGFYGDPATAMYNLI